MASKHASNPSATDATLDALLARLASVESRLASTAPPSTREIERVAEIAAAKSFDVVKELLDTQHSQIQILTERLKKFERMKAPVIPKFDKWAASAMEPVVDEIVNIERSLKDDIKSGTARASANALEARNAAAGTVLASEAALKAIASYFAYGDAE